MKKYSEDPELKPYIRQPEDVLSYALFPQVALNYFRYRAANEYHVDSDIADPSKGIQIV